MGLLNRKSKEKGAWRKPASEYTVFCGICADWRRHRVQAATTQGLAAHSDAEDGVADAFHRRLYLCTHRRPSHLGLFPRVTDLL